MNGGQPVDGNLSVSQIILQLRSEGIERIALISDEPTRHKSIGHFPGYSLDHRDDLITVEKELRDIPSTTMLIFEQTCASEKHRRRKKGELEDPNVRVFINKAVCEGCGDCSVQSNCLSVIPVETELGRKRRFDQSACTKDRSCLKGFCPSFVTITGGNLKKPAPNLSENNAPVLPEPVLADITEQPWNIVVTGIGGTGVLTVTALVAMAAHIEGKGCSTMNQTGLAQKFGSVVSYVRVGVAQRSINAVRNPAGDADLLLGCDLVVSAGDEAMAKVNVERSHAIINAAESAMAEFVNNPDAVFHADAMKQTINEEVGIEKVSFIDATAMATNLLGDSIAGNLFLLGYAYQSGLIPVSADAIE
ncbi:MAG: indolepyruvate ferredoxin oxidoreductase [Candidatus Azotimanducaceae bacterium]|jgi:indolepyruvate ferredoxin oxidoreductase